MNTYTMAEIEERKPRYMFFLTPEQISHEDNLVTTGLKLILLHLLVLTPVYWTKNLLVIWKHLRLAINPFCQ